ncbi:MAG: hydroxymethylglutaryl-CoA lyase [Gammaproteobacteria bacterium]
MTTTLAKHIKLVEVGPRDGLQNETKLLSTEIKLEFIHRLAASGLRYIEATSFVSPKWIPQMADHTALVQGLDFTTGIHYPVLVPNMRGLEAAIAAGVNEIAIFTAASDTFCQRNINCTITQSLNNYRQVIETAHQHNIKVRGYISCVVGCPYEGVITPQQVAPIAQTLYELGCYEISLGDTIGIGTAKNISELLGTLSSNIPIEKLAGHFHNTYGQALVNIYVALQLGVTTFDCSVAGLGGCPYAHGASGNVATEDVVYLLHGLGFETGIDLTQLIAAGEYINQHLSRTSQSAVAIALTQCS